MSTRSKKKREAKEANLYIHDSNPHKKRKLSQNTNEITDQTTTKKIAHNINEESKTKETDIDDFDDFDDNDGFGDDANEDADDWDNLGDLNFDGQQQVKIYNPESLSADQRMKQLKEKRRILNSNMSRFWKCGKCEFLNHPSSAQCLSCNMPEIDIIRFLLNCTEPLKKCTKCNSFIIPKQFDEHELDCDPIIKNTNTNKKNNNWHCALSKSEKNAVCYVTNLAFTKSEKDGEIQKLLTTIKEINQDLKFGESEQQILEKLLKFLEWKVPITIRVHCSELIPKLLHDTNYRNLFETGYGSGNIDEKIRKREEMKMFGEVYFGADPDERPKYGCLNINLLPQGCMLAYQYGDGYFVMNDATIRWRVTMTIKDSFAVNGDCATLKNCKHLLNQLEKEELKEMIQVAVFGKDGNKKNNQQKAYREIQIHGPVVLNRDVWSMHVPNNHKNRQFEDTYKLFCQKNDIKLVWF